MRVSPLGSLMDMSLRTAVLAMVFMTTAACQTTGESAPESRPATEYSGYFYWESERALGQNALQCMQLIFSRSEKLPDGRMRLEGVTRYITGPEDEENFVEAEMIFDPGAGTFVMWEHNATSDSFVSDGKFEGRFRTGMLFLEGKWASDNDGEPGYLTLRRGTDAPCAHDLLI